MAYVVLAESAPYVMNITQTGNGVTLTSGKRYMVTSTVACYVIVSASNATNATSANGHFVAAGSPWPPMEHGPLRMATGRLAISAGTDGATGSLYVHEVAER